MHASQLLPDLPQIKLVEYSIGGDDDQRRKNTDTTNPFRRGCVPSKNQPGRENKAKNY
jgi:hypothetical protein